MPPHLRAGAADGAVDAATLGRTFAELGAAGLPASWAVPGAGRWSAGDVRATGPAGTRFPAGPGPSVRAHGDVVAGRPATTSPCARTLGPGPAGNLVPAGPVARTSPADQRPAPGTAHEAGSPAAPSSAKVRPSVAASTAPSAAPARR